MRDGIGSVVMISVICFFIVAVSAFLAFNVNYTKAFRMKNKIISVYDEYDGLCTGTAGDRPSASCIGEIIDYANSIGYQPIVINCASGYTPKPMGSNPLFCEKEVKAIKTYDGGNNPSGIDSSGRVGDKIGDHYYTIYTVININIPVFNNLFSEKFLGVYGDTRLFE